MPNKIRARHTVKPSRRARQAAKQTEEEGSQPSVSSRTVRHTARQSNRAKHTAKQTRQQGTQPSISSRIIRHTAKHSCCSRQPNKRRARYTARQTEEQAKHHIFSNASTQQQHFSKAVRHTTKCNKSLEQEPNTAKRLELKCNPPRKARHTAKHDSPATYEGEKGQKHRRLLTGRTAKGFGRVWLQEISLHGRLQPQVETSARSSSPFQQFQRASSDAERSRRRYKAQGQGSRVQAAALRRAVGGVGPLLRERQLLQVFILFF